jgi:hypothetical protein
MPNGAAMVRALPVRQPPCTLSKSLDFDIGGADQIVRNGTNEQK